MYEEVKLRRGPMKQKVVSLEVYNNDILIRVNEPVRMSDMHPYDPYDPYLPVKYKEGTYHRSNERDRQGRWIFEWMGWKS
jgi:hypothetical protein